MPPVTAPKHMCDTLFVYLIFVKCSNICTFYKYLLCIFVKCTDICTFGKCLSVTATKHMCDTLWICFKDISTYCLVSGICTVHFINIYSVSDVHFQICFNPIYDIYENCELPFNINRALVSITCADVWCSFRW